MALYVTPRKKPSPERIDLGTFQRIANFGKWLVGLSVLGLATIEGLKSVRSINSTELAPSVSGLSRDGNQVPVNFNELAGNGLGFLREQAGNVMTMTGIVAAATLAAVGYAAYRSRVKADQGELSRQLRISEWEDVGTRPQNFANWGNEIFVTPQHIVPAQPAHTSNVVSIPVSRPEPTAPPPIAA